MADETPDWVGETPDYSYRLIMFNPNDFDAQSADLTRGEFIALKAHLAAMRGYNAPTLADALETIRTDEELASYSSEDDQQVARHLERARDLYRRVPHLVTVQSEDFDNEVSRIAEN